MKKMAPMILLSSCSEKRGAEFDDASLSLSNCYCNALTAAGGLPVVLPLSSSQAIIAETLRRCDGVLLTGGEDVQTALYTRRLSLQLKAKMGATNPERDLFELILIDEVFRQRKPLLAICRGIQMLNVALGGTLLVDIPSQRPKAEKHNCSDRKNDLVHEVLLTRGSLLATILGKRTLAVNSSHHQAVSRVAKPFEVTARSADGIIEALELKERESGMLPYLLAVQFHPERLVKKHVEFLQLFKSFVGSCGGRGWKIV